MSSLKEKIKATLLDAGFDLVGFTTAEPLPRDGLHLETWLASGHAGAMNYLERAPVQRADPGAFLPGARSIVVVAAAYEPLSGPGPLAAYAYYTDYHETMRIALQQGVDVITGADDATACRIAVDTAPLLERALARRAGLGWIGYSGNLITRDFGPHVHLGVIATTALLEPDPPDTAENASVCASCERCLEACPTGALNAPFTLDARACISYLTIEKRGPFTPEEARSIHGWAFGCDHCTASCLEGPSSFPMKKPAGLLIPSTALKEAGLKTLLDYCERGFKRNFKNTALLRCGKGGLIRNILCAARNQDEPWLSKRAEPYLREGTPASQWAAQYALDAL